jgi:chemotaxis protein MotA
MDAATLIGILAGFGLLGWAILSKGSAGTFIDVASVAIVIGGGISATMVALPLKNFIGSLRVVKHAFFSKKVDILRYITDMVGFADVARRDGILSLENMTGKIDDPFVIRGIQMVVDGTDPQLTEQILSSELEAIADRHATGRAFFESLGKYTPAFGMIGTLIGLVIMLLNMGGDASSIGPAMATALLTTLYGALMANLIALPIADKLSTRSNEELLVKGIVIRGVLSIQAGENPRIVEQKLQTFLPPSMRTTPER